ncbi:MAG: AEC family transporter [Succiniclasticum sp.]|jgi:predicted permease|nr:AEC family transporter [Succiniclasticum sp.]MEE3478635.1 AEC family transporter [Succiniclasticum sp.]
MMEQYLKYFVIAFNAIVPMFMLIVIGTFIRIGKLLTDTEIRHVNRMVFEIFFFCMMFYNLYNTTFSIAFRPKLIIFAIIAVLLVIAAAFFVVCNMVTDTKTRGAMIQAIYRSNLVLLGVPMVENLFGEESLAVPTMIIAVIVPLYNILSVFILELFRGEGKFSLSAMLLNILKNPMIIGAIFGFFFLITGWKLPPVIIKPIGQLAKCTSPVALLILGASFKLGTLGNDIRDLVITVAGRLLIVPGIVLPIAMFLGFRGVEFITLVSIFATPCAVASFTMAQELGSNAELAGNAVVVSSALSCFTLFFWIVLFQILGVL